MFEVRLPISKAQNAQGITQFLIESGRLEFVRPKMSRRLRKLSLGRWRHKRGQVHIPHPWSRPITFRQAQRADRSTNRARDEDEWLARWAGERRGWGDLSRSAGPGWGKGWPVGPEVGLG
jgi:hypothetical protein